MLLILLPLLIFAVYTAAAAVTSGTAKLRIHPEDRVRAAEGSEVSFGCFAEDSTVVNRVEWKFVNNSNFDLWLFSAGGRVLIPSATFNLTGVYECEGYFGARKIQSAFLQLQVLRPVRIETFVTGVRNVTVLTCRVRSDSPVANVLWYWNGENVDGYDVFRANNESDQRFSLEVAEENWTKGKFSCVVANDFGQNSSAQFSLPPDPSTARIEVFRETIRVRIGKEWCLNRIEVRLSTNETVAIQCRSADPINAFKQLISGFVDVIVSPKRLEANSVYYGRAVVVDSNGKEIPNSDSSFVFETNERSSNRRMHPEAVVGLMWMLSIGIQIL